MCEIVADFAVGKALIGSGTPLAHDSVMPLFSSAKSITSVAIRALVDSGRLNFDDPVATHGKSGWVPGDRAAYLPTAGWHMLGEVVERVSGSSFGSFVQSFVL